MVREQTVWQTPRGELVKAKAGIHPIVPCEQRIDHRCWDLTTATYITIGITPQ
jgi:hypothetical protein